MVGECAGISVLAEKSLLILRYLVSLLTYKTGNGRIGTRRKISFKIDYTGIAKSGDDCKCISRSVLAK